MFIVIEGIDGSGKSTVMNAIKMRYLARNKTICSIDSIQEDTMNGKYIRETISGNDKTRQSVIEYNYILDNITASNKIYDATYRDVDLILKDRYFPSTLVYGKPEFIETVNEAMRYCAKPDMYILLTTPVETCIKRLRKDKGEERDVYENESKLLNYYSKYLSLFKDNQFMDGTPCYYLDTSIGDEKFIRELELILDKIDDSILDNYSLDLSVIKNLQGN